MMPRSSSSLAIALLERVVPDSDALAGDLLEQVGNGRSPAWLWTQVLAAVVTALVNPTDDIRPLKLVELQPADAIERSRRFNLQSCQINLTASPLHGAGGLTLALFGVLLTQLASVLWWVLLLSIVAGTLLGIGLIVCHRRASARSPFVFEGLVPRYASRSALVLAMVVASSAAFAQTPTPAPARSSRPAFDVSSVKINTGGGRGGAIQPGRFAQSAVTLRQLIRLAYGSNQIVGGPGWIESDRFDVEGKGTFDLRGFLPGPNGTPPAVYQMLQQLLEDRFTLAVHTAIQDRPVYALLMARRDQQAGSQLTRSAFDCEALLAATVGGRLPAPPPQAALPRCAVGGAPGHLMADSIEMSQLAAALSPFTDRVVLNRTNLPGRFNVDLQWTPELTGPAPTPSANAAATDAPPALVTAIQEQLGLKLEPITAPIEVLVIDNANRPTPN
jgi:uncharacterized protein (TIGR03435 family)